MLVGRAELYVWLLNLAVEVLWLSSSAISEALIGTPRGSALSLEEYGLTQAGLAFAALLIAAYPYVRLSLVGAMIVGDNRFHLLEAWRMTEGKVWRLLGLYVLLTLVAGTVTALRLQVELLSGHFLQTRGSLQDLLTHPTVPPFVSAALNVPISAFTLVVGTAPWARVYRDLSSTPDYAEVFA